MARILFAWELGEGLGHLVPVAPLLRELSDRGHTVYAALRDVTRARLVLTDDRIVLLPAPCKFGPSGDEIPRAASFAHVLHNIGFGSASALGGLSEAWRNLFLAVRPDLILFDHSPSALLAARGLPAARVVVGTGFVCPPPGQVLPAIRPWQGVPVDVLRDAERGALANANAVLHRVGQAPLPDLARLYAEVDDTILLTFRELDHYSERPGGQYWGAATATGGRPPSWLPGTRKRVFAYLKPTRWLTAVLADLARTDADVLAYVPGLRPEARVALAGSPVRCIDAPVDMAVTAATCHAAVLNGTHGAAVAMLLAGKPTVHVPIHVEQAVLAYRVQAIRAGRGVPPNRAPTVTEALESVLRDPRPAAAAGRFASKYHDFDAGKQATALADRFQQILQTNVRERVV